MVNVLHKVAGINHDRPFYLPAGQLFKTAAMECSECIVARRWISRQQQMRCCRNFWFALEPSRDNKNRERERERQNFLEFEEEGEGGKKEGKKERKATKRVSPPLADSLKQLEHVVR